MGRGKIEIKRIENTTNRQVTYSKRKTGIMKKAKEITVLCDAKVSLVIFSSSGKMADFCSPNTTLVKILEEYHKASGKRLWDAKHEYLNSEVDRVKKENDSMKIELRHLKGEDLTSLHPKELIPIEEALENGLAGVKAKQSELLKVMKKNTRMLEEDNKRLSYTLHHQELEMANGHSVREMGNNGYHNNNNHHHQHHYNHHQKGERDQYHQQQQQSQMPPLAFSRVQQQAIQSNLNGSDNK